MTLATSQVLSTHVWLVTTILMQVENTSIIAENSGQQRSRAMLLLAGPAADLCRSLTAQVLMWQVSVGPRSPHF